MINTNTIRSKSTHSLTQHPLNTHFKLTRIIHNASLHYPILHSTFQYIYYATSNYTD